MTQKTIKRPPELTMIFSALEGMDTKVGISMLTYSLGAVIATTKKSDMSEESIERILESIKEGVRLSYVIHCAPVGKEDEAVQLMRASKGTIQ